MVLATKSKHSPACRDQPQYEYPCPCRVWNLCGGTCSAARRMAGAGAPEVVINSIDRAIAAAVGGEGAALLAATSGRSPCPLNGPEYRSELPSLAAQIQWNLVGARLNGGSQVGGLQTVVFFRCDQTADRWSLPGRCRPIVSSDDSDSIFSRLKPLLAAGAEFVGSVVSNHPIHGRPIPYRMKRHHAAAERLCVKQNVSCDKRIVLAATSNDA